MYHQRRKLHSAYWCAWQKYDKINLDVYVRKKSERRFLRVEALIETLKEQILCSSQSVVRQVAVAGREMGEDSPPEINRSRNGDRKLNFSFRQYKSKTHSDRQQLCWNKLEVLLQKILSNTAIAQCAVWVVRWPCSQNGPVSGTIRRRRGYRGIF